MPDFHTLPLWSNLAVFAVAAAVVWFAGARLARYVDEIGARTGLEQAFLGLLLLGVATSLPEVATTIGGATIGNAPLVVGNLFGGVSLQIAVLAIVDMVAMRRALTFFTPQPVLLLQGVMLLLLLSVALAGAGVGEPLAWGRIGATPVLLAIGYVFVLQATRGGTFVPSWRATNLPDRPERRQPESRVFAGTTNARVYGFAAGAAAIIFAAGWVVARVGDALAMQTGLGASFVGVALVAASTSLPELSTTLTAVRLGRHEMAVSGILGTNCLEMALLLLADVTYRDGPILAATDRSAFVAGTMGLIVTCIYLLGLLERQDRTIGRLGWDSFAVLIAYGVGLAALYYVR